MPVTLNPSSKLGFIAFLFTFQRTLSNLTRHNLAASSALITVIALQIGDFIMTPLSDCVIKN